MQDLDSLSQRSQAEQLRQRAWVPSPQQTDFAPSEPHVSTQLPLTQLWQ